MNRNEIPQDIQKQHPPRIQRDGIWYKLDPETETYHLMTEEETIQNTQAQEESSPLTYRQKLKRMITEQNPIMRNRLLAQGEWSSWLDEKGNQLEAHYEELLMTMEQKMPQPEGYLEAVSWKTQLAARAAEIVDSEMLLLLEE